MASYSEMRYVIHVPCCKLFIMIIIDKSSLLLNWKSCIFGESPFQVANGHASSRARVD